MSDIHELPEMKEFEESIAYLLALENPQDHFALLQSTRFHVVTNIPGVAKTLRKTYKGPSLTIRYVSNTDDVVGTNIYAALLQVDTEEDQKLHDFIYNRVYSRYGAKGGGLSEGPKLLRTV